MPTSGPTGLQKRDVGGCSFGPARGALTTPAKGLLDPRRAADHLRLTRLAPAADLAPSVGYFWAVEWDLPAGVEHDQSTISDACCHLVFGPGTTALFGVVRGRFTAHLAGRGKVLGVRLLPGAARGVYGRSLSRLTDRTATLGEVFGLDDREAEAAVMAAAGPAAMARVAGRLLAPRLPPPDATARLVARIAQRAADDRGLTRVEDLAAAAGLGMRDLQRVFREYVGVTPKWVLRRYRLQEVAHRLASGQAVDLTRLAHDLGYFDHAHLTRDFRAMTGHSPAAYRAANAPPADAAPTSARSPAATAARGTSPAASRPSSPS